MSESNGTALIGHTGFVGGNLATQVKYDAYYNSTNISEIDGRHFSCLTIAAVQAKKWWANLHPEEDWRGIQALRDRLVSVRTEEVILISTIDVLGDGGGLDERSEPNPSTLGAYGRHRLRFEQEVRDLFERVLVVRLPGLFGPGLKKNVIFDLMTSNELRKINPDSSLQYYDLRRLARDVDVARAAGVRMLHLFPEPISTSLLINELFPGTLVGEERVPEVHYDHRTEHAALFGGERGYIASKGVVLEQMKHFIETVRMQGT